MMKPIVTFATLQTCLKTNQSTLYTAKVAVYAETGSKHINTPVGRMYNYLMLNLVVHTVTTRL